MKATSPSPNGHTRGLTITRGTKFADWPELLSVDEVAAVTNVGRNAIYDLIKRGEIKAVKFGRLLRVPKASLLDVMK